MADLIDEIGGGAEVETLFFGEGVKASKKRRRQRVRPDDCIVEGEVSLRKN